MASSLTLSKVQMLRYFLGHPNLGLTRLCSSPKSRVTRPITTYANNQLYIEEFCLDPATCSNFTILNSSGDGIIAPGYYEINYNDNLIRPAGGFVGSSESTILPCGLK